MIRLANKFDNAEIIKLFKEFQEKHQLGLVEEKFKWSEEYANQQLNKLYAGLGFVLVDDEYKGVLCVIKAPCFWVKDLFILQEVMWYGQDKKTSVRLLKEYIKIAKKLKEDKYIKEFYFSSLNNTNFEKYGAKITAYDCVIQ